VGCLFGRTCSNIPEWNLVLPQLLAIKLRTLRTDRIYGWFAEATDLQFEHSLVERLQGRLFVRVFQHELERAHDGVEKAVDDDLVHVINVRFPDVTVGVSGQELAVLLSKPTTQQLVRETSESTALINNQWRSDSCIFKKSFKMITFKLQQTTRM